MPGHLQGGTNPVRNHCWATKTRPEPPGGRLQRSKDAHSHNGVQAIRSLVLQREDRQKHLTAVGFYFYTPIQAKIFKSSNSPRRISLHLVPELLMKTLKKAKKKNPPHRRHPTQPQPAHGFLGRTCCYTKAEPAPFSLVKPPNFIPWPKSPSRRTQTSWPDFHRFHVPTLVGHKEAA